MKDTIKAEAVINGIKFQHIARDCGGIIVIDGKRGFTWASMDGSEKSATSGAGVYHCVNGVSTLIEGVSVADYRAAMGL